MRTDEKLTELVERLQYNCGDIHEAARWCGVSPHFVFTWIKEDKVAAEAIEEARRVGYAGLESEAIRRAVQGVEKGVYFKGEKVDTEIQYSDQLLGKLLEAKVTEFKKGDAGATFNGPTQINIMPRANSYSEWLTMRDETLARRDGEALPAPIEGEYVEIPSDKPLAGLAGLGL